MRLELRKLHGIDKNQGGAVLPIVAILSLALLSAITVLAIDTLLVKDAQRRLRTSVDAICHRIAPLALNHTKARAEFERRISVLNTEVEGSYLRRTQITDARLLIPTMPEVFDRESSAIWIQSAGENCASDQANIDKKSSHITFCNNIDAPALNHNKVGRSPGSLFPPSTLINESSHGKAPNSGMTVGCEIVASIDRIFQFTDKDRAIPVKVKSLWWTPVRSMLKSKPGLTIAIAPEIETSSQSPLNIFHSTFIDERNIESELYSQELFRDRFSAAARADLSTSFKTSAFVGGADHQLVLNDSTFILPKFMLAFSRDGDYSALSDALTACSNPVTLVRNQLVSAIAEFASRHGQLRDSTEVLTVNPLSPGSALNPPSLIAKYGEDIAQELFQLPFVLSKQLFGDPAPAESSWNNLFAKEESSQFQHKLLFGQQLRMCFHLYDRVNEVGGIERYLPLLLRDALENSNYEPPLYGTTFQSNLRSSLYSSKGGETLDQSNPWTAPEGAKASQLLTVSQTLSALGTIQHCPANAQYCTSESDCAEVCKKGTKLAPDLKSLFRYLTADPISAEEKAAFGTNATKPINFPAISAPGIFPFNENTLEDENTQFPLKAQNYTTADSLSTHILLVLHMVPENIGELREFITNLSVGIQGTPRPITIVYIPSNPSDASQQTVAKLKAVISPVDSKGSPLVPIIPPALFVLAPSSDGTIPLTDSDLILYWHKLLTDDDDNEENGESIIEIAQSIFSDRILRMELRY